MAAVAHASPADIRRLALVRTGPVVRPARTALPATVYRRRRAVAVLLVVSVAAVLVLAVAGPPGVRSEVVPSPPPSVRGRRRRRSTSSSRATRSGRSPAGCDPGEDPRPLVARLVAAHGSPVLVAGERLALPAAA